MKKSILALLLAVLMVASLLPAAALAQNVVAKIGDVEYTDLATALKAAQDGDIVEIMPGEYELVGDNGRPAFTIWKAVSIKGSGAGSTIITGRIEYGVTGQATDDCNTITVEGITLKPDGGNNDLGICWSNDQSGNANNTLSGYDLVVKNCILDGWKYAVGVNSNAASCKLMVTNTAFVDVFCAASVQEGPNNKIESFVAADGSNMQMVAQVWGEGYNGYYDSYDKLVADTERENPTLNNPSSSDIVWPAAAILNGQYYSTIQAAVNAATSGDTINILPGTHVMAVNESITITKQLTIKGDGISSTVVGSGSSTAGHSLFNFGAGSEGSTLKDFKIDYTGTTSDCAAVYFNGGFTDLEKETTIKNVDFIGGNTTGEQIGILSTYIKGGNITIEDCYFYNFKYAMYFNAVNDLAVIGNTIDTTRRNAINIAGDNPAAPCTDIVISGNTLRNISSDNHASEEYSSGIRVGVNVTGTFVKDNNISMLNGKTPVYYDPDTSDNPVRFIVKYVSNGVVIELYAVDAANSTIPLYGAPYNPGYAFLGWNDGVTTYSELAQYTVTEDTTFTAVWVRHPDTEYVPEPEQPVEPETPVFPFYDVPTSAWYYTAVKYVYDNKLMDGVDTYVFAPNDTLTRAMVWTIIARMSGVDTTGGNSWYAKAQEWVVVNGISDGENPTAAITREQLVTMLYRYAQIKGYDVSVGESTNILSYVDATSISEYAMSAFQWACGSGLTEGDENGALTPLATATRAQAAAMIMRFLSK